jgi:hypothetical protein
VAIGSIEKRRPQTRSALFKRVKRDSLLRTIRLQKFAQEETKIESQILSERYPVGGFFAQELEQGINLIYNGLVRKKVLKS